MTVVKHEFYPRRHPVSSQPMALGTLIDALQERQEGVMQHAVVNLAVYREQQAVCLRIAMGNVDLLPRLRRALRALGSMRKCIFLKHWDALSKAEQTAAVWHLILNVSPTRDFRWGDMLYAIRVGYKKVRGE